MKPIILLLFFLISVSSSYSQSYPIQINEEGFIFTEATINDSVKGTFILDTGAGTTVFSGKFFEKIRASAEERSIGTGFRHDGERIDMLTYKLSSISIGDYKSENITTGIYPPLDDYGIDGIISLKEFEDQPFTIDFKNQLLIIEDRESLEGLEKTGDIIPVKFRSYTDLMLDVFVPVCINDSITIEAEFDTGSGYKTLYVNPYYISKLGIDTTALQLDGNNKYGKIGSVKICGSDKTEMKDRSIYFKQGLIYEGLIGSEAFRDKKLTIDIPGKQFIVNE